MGNDARRRAALNRMHERHPAVAQRVQRVYGLRLPRHLAVFCAFWDSADDAERTALDHLMVRPFGLTECRRPGRNPPPGRRNATQMTALTLRLSILAVTLTRPTPPASH